MAPETVTYRIGSDLNLDAVIDLYVASTLGERRPVADRECMARMISEANLVVTAWDGDRLVGISRSLTDFCYICYLADLAVHSAYQRSGIGQELIRRTQAALGPNARIILLAAPAANDYYPHVGFAHHPRAWMIGAEIRWDKRPSIVILRPTIPQGGMRSHEKLAGARCFGTLSPKTMHCHSERMG